MSSFKLSFTAVLLCVAFSSCRGQGQSGGGGGAGSAGGGGEGSGISAVVPGTQDSVQIVAQAALCFDNRPVLNGCLQAMGVNASGGKGGASMPAPGAPAIMCSPPCFGHVTMMMSCVNSIFGNFATYNPGLMQGVQAVFQMSCGNVNGPAGGPGAGAGGAAGGAGGAAGGAGGAVGGVGGGAAGAGAGGIPNTIGGAVGGGGGAGGAGTGIVGGVSGGAGMGSAGGVTGGIPNSIAGAAAGGGGGAGAGGASGGSGTVSSVGGAASGGGGGNDTTIAAGAVGTNSGSNDTNVVPLPPKHNAGSHVAVSNQSQPTSSADGPTFSLKGACSSVLLVISAAAWMMLV